MSGPFLPTSPRSWSPAPVTWDRTRARNQGRRLRSALEDERMQRAQARRGVPPLRDADVRGESYALSTRYTEERIAWRIGHHAGRLFALREARADSTCTECPHRRECEHEGDPYNTHGDCLADK